MRIPGYEKLTNAVLMRRCIGIAIRDGNWSNAPCEQSDANPWASLENRWAREYRVTGVRALHGEGVWAIALYQGEYVGPVPLCSMFSITEERAFELLSDLG